MPTLLTTAAALGWIGLWVVQADGLLVTTFWVGGAAALFAAHSLGRRQHCLEIGLVVLTAAGAKWLLVDALGTRIGPEWDAVTLVPFANAQMGLAIVIGAGLFWALRILQQRESGKAALPGWAAVAASLVLLTGFSFEIERIIAGFTDGATTMAPPLLRGLWLTGLWAVGGLGMIVIGDAAGLRRLVQSGWCLQKRPW